MLEVILIINQFFFPSKCLAQVIHTFRIQDSIYNNSQPIN